MNRDKVIHQIRRLAIASDSFQQCVALLAHIQEMGMTLENDLYPPMIAGVVVTYSKNFNEAEGLGPLPSSFTHFTDSTLQTAHLKLVDSRNRLYAHRDASAHSIKSTDGGVSEYLVQVRINDDNTAFLFQPHLVDIPPGRIPDIKRLIQHQMERLQDDLDSKLALVVDFEKGYKQGVTYVLGRDFP